MTQELKTKVDRAIKLIQSASKVAMEHGQPLEVAYSGGKDSDVILELTKMANVPYRAIYKNTTIDPSGTIKHVRNKGVEVLQPKETFFELIRKMGFPNRFHRFCCGYLKEYKVLDYVIIGVRKEESPRRAKRYQEPEICRVYSKTSKSRHYMPLLDWTNDDVKEFVNEREIQCHPLYYDTKGDFIPERRLGCIACPLIYKKKRIEQFKRYPQMVKAYCKAGQIWLDTHPQSQASQTYQDVYGYFVRNLFYDDDNEGWTRLRNGLFTPPPFKEFYKITLKLNFKETKNYYGNEKTLCKERKRQICALSRTRTAVS